MIATLASSLLMLGVVVGPQAAAADGPVVSLGDAAGLERDSVTGSVFVPVFLSEPAAAPVTVSFFTTAGTASSAVDYSRWGTPTAPRTLTIPAGSLQSTINVPVLADSLQEGDESFSVMISSVSGGDATIGDDTGTARIVDVDAASVDNPVINVSAGTVVEGDVGQRRAQFHVQLSRTPVSTVTISYVTADFTAVAPADYTAKLPGTAVFAPGQISKTIDVLVNSNITADTDRWLTLNVGVIGGSPVEELAMSVDATIVNDDGGAVPCAPGTYSETGTEPCIPAPAGFFVATAGATSATPCPAGRYQPNTGQISCVLAPMGFYVPVTGATSATPADSGTFVDVVGAASATPCAVGSSQPNTASTSCLLAPIGSYVAVTGSTTATACPNGTTTLTTGSTSANDCMPEQDGGAVAITAGVAHTCALLTDGAARCWGNNSGGQLGNGTTANSNAPVVVSGLTGAVAIAAGSYGNHTCALLGDGTVSCWGNNANGQLGDGTTTRSSVPVSVPGVSGAVAITAGSQHTCAVLADGSARCWGYNVYGQLGNGTNTNSNTPVVVSGLTDAVAITAGIYSTCALLGDGTARCWGNNNNGHLGNGTFTDSNLPVTVSGLSNAVAITAGNVHVCAILGDGTARCWGRNVDGRLGNGNNTSSSVPVTVSGLSNAVAITGGFSHTCAVLTDGTSRCWGDNSFGKLGNGTFAGSNVPVAVSGLTNATAIAAGWGHTCAVLGAGTVRCWGIGSGGELGNGTWNTFSSNVPVAVVGIP